MMRSIWSYLRDFQARGESNGMVCTLVKYLCGLKQATRQWDLKLSEELLNTGFIQSKLDHSLFIKKQGTHIVVILVYVDDMLITRNGLALIEHTKESLHKAFKIKYISDLMYFLGMEFSRSGNGMLINQRKYALDIISQLGLGNTKPSWTPL